MRKIVALLSLALVLVAAGCGFGGKSEGEQVGAAILGMIDRANLTAGAANLQQWYQAHGTYAGATPGVPGVTLARADGSSWCLETASAHEAGPNGTPTPGGC
jgi:hypothetical protein